MITKAQKYAIAHAIRLIEAEYGSNKYRLLIDELESIIPEWISIEEIGMPDEQMRVHATLGTMIFDDVYYGTYNIRSVMGEPEHLQVNEKHWRWTHSGEILVHIPSHWMPHTLPPEPIMNPPKSGFEKEFVHSVLKKNADA